MALSTQPKLASNGVIRILNGTSTLTCATDEGDFKSSGLGRRLNAPVRVSRRGRHMGTGYGARRYPTVSLSEKVLSMTATSAPGSIRDMVTGQGPYASDVGTLGTGNVYCVDIEYTATDSTGATSDVLYFHDVDFNAYDFEEGEPSTFSLPGEVLGDVTLNGTTIAREIGAGGT